MAGGCCSELLLLYPGSVYATGTSGRHCPCENCAYMPHSQVSGGTAYPMLMSGDDGGASVNRRLAAELEQRRLRSLAIARDIELGLPQTLPMPDGEEFPYSANHFHIRTFEQEREIYQACIRPPPNRTLENREISMSKLATSISSFKSGLVANFSRVDKAAQAAPPSATHRSALTVIVPSMRRSPELVQRSPKRPRRKSERAPKEHPECSGCYREPAPVNCERWECEPDSGSTTSESTVGVPEWAQLDWDGVWGSVEQLRRSPEAQQLLPFSHSDTTLSGVRVLGCDGVLPSSVPIARLGRGTVIEEQRNA